VRTNPSKQRLDRGLTELGTMINAASPLAAEFLGHCGYDFLVVDLQHGETGMETLGVMLQALSSTPATPIVRVPANVPVYIQRALDLGAYGIIVPQVDTRAQAEAVVESVRYAPRGKRSWGPVRGTIYGGPDYFSKSAEQLLVLPMLESAQALGNAAEILGVDGVDGCFIGPADLNITLGHSPEDPQLGPQTEEGIATILRVTQAAGKIAGMHTTSVDDARRRVAQGFRFITLMADLRMLRSCATAAIAALRAPA
jgi:4-hydroxy-2-oxoheptanedioate aldolase